ncbi:MAG: alpha/beta fold hydrolase [Acidobacteria bacterium]|nr:alpha/beta fold hydrolase [Acidobacteriota bacterium]
MIVQGPAWGPSVEYLEKTLGPLLRQWRPHFYAPRNTPGGMRVIEDASQASDKLAADLEVQRQGLGVEKAIRVGHSHGALLALAYAIKYPDRVAALVLLAPSVDAPGTNRESAAVLEEFRGDPWRRAAIECWDRDAQLRGSVADDRALARRLRVLAPLNFWCRTALEEFQNSLRHTSPPSSAALAGMPAAPESWIRAGLAEVVAPVLCVAGRHDFLTPPAAAFAVSSKLRAGRLLVVDHAGHNPWVERPAAVGDAILAFLQREIRTQA